LETLIQVGTRAVSNLDVSVAAFRTTVDQEFAHAAKLQHLSSQQLADVTGQAQTASEFMTASARTFSETVESSSGSFRALDESIEQRLLDGQQQFQVLVERLSARMDALIGHMQALAGNVTSTANEFHKASAHFVPAVTSFRAAVEHHFRPAAALHQQQAVIVSETVEQLKASTANLPQRTAAAQTMLERQREFAEAAGRTQQLLATAVEDLAVAVARLRKGVESHVGPSNKILHDAASSLAASTTQLSSFISSGLGHATTRLSDFDDTLTRLEGSLVELERFSRSGEG
jgi:hypothetical protein